MRIPFLSSKRVRLCPLSMSHLNGDYVRWLNDPDVCRFNSHHRFPLTLSAARDFVRRASQSERDLVLAIETRSTRRHIGNIALQAIDAVSRNAEFAILLGDRRYWGKGISKEAGHLLVAHGFQQLNLHRIHCGTTEENVPMQKLAASLGMRPEGRRREATFKGGRFVDILEFGVLRPEYEAHARPSLR